MLLAGAGVRPRARPAAASAAVAAVALDTAALRDGDLVFRRGRSVESWAVRTVQGRRGLSHVGLLEHTGHGWMVVHARPGDPRHHPGRVVREPLLAFLAPADADSVAVYRGAVPAWAVARALQAADRMVAAAVAFDDDFDLGTPDRVYCTELVVRAYAAASVDVSAGLRDTLALFGRRRVLVLPATLARSPWLRPVLVTR